MNRLVHAKITLAVGLLALLSWGAGQRFDANVYYQQCLRLEDGGDLQTALQSCRNALTLDPTLTDAELSLARLEVALGQYASAERRLQGLRERVNSAEPHLLLAEIALAERRFAAAESHLHGATQRLAAQFNSQYEGRRHFLQGRLHEQLGRYQQALESFERAAESDGLEPRYRVAQAESRLRLGDPWRSKEELESFLAFAAGDDPNTQGNAQLYSLLGQARWATGDLTGAARAFEQAVSARSTLERRAVEQDLENLALVYYAQGDLRSGRLTLQTAMRRGNLLTSLLNRALPWLLGLLVLLALHLIGESRITPNNTLETVEGPQLWTVGQGYAMLLTGVVIAGIVTLLSSALFYGNILAFLTPLQAEGARAIFLATLAVILALLSIRSAKARGWEPLEALLGGSDNALMGVGLGLALLVVILAYQLYAPDIPWLQGFYLDFSRITPLLVIAATLLPLSELFFRSFLVPSLEQHYDPRLATLISGTLYALVLGTPLVLLFAFGLVLSSVLLRSRSGLVPFLAQLTLHVGLVLGAGFSGWMRGLFL